MKSKKRVLTAVILAFVFLVTSFGTILAEESADKPANIDSLPRNETLYFNGMQWGPIVSFNPLSSSNNNVWLFGQGDAAIVLMYETLYMYNMNDGKLYPLLADGDYEQDGNVFTIKIKKAAHWSDGEPLTAHDVVYSYKLNAEMQTNMAEAMDWIDEIEAIDNYTVQITAKEEGFNPYKIVEYFPKMYILPEHQMSKLVERNDGDPAKVKEDPNEDIVTSGPYLRYFDDTTRVIAIRDDNYWGQDESMWGKLPAPKYLAHMLFSDNNAGSVAFQQGEVDVSQQFIPQVWTLWEEGLPVSTYLDEEPYYIGGVIPMIAYNMNREGLDDPVIRRAIAMSVDYEQIGEAAMSGYTLPIEACLMNQTEPEQKLYRQEDIKDLQWTGLQTDEANELLDEAGYVDSDGDGIREKDGENLSFKIECPNGWTDWNATCEIVAAAGKEIGIEISTYFPEYPVYSEDIMGGNFDMVMVMYSGSSYVSPWMRIYQTLYSNYGANQDAEQVFFNYGRFTNDEVDELIDKIPTMSEEEQIDAYTRINEIYLEEVPTFPCMYRPNSWHTVNESVWTNFPEADDGRNIPPQVLVCGYSIAGLYDLELVNP